MGGGRYSPSFWEAVGVQLLCIGLLAILPLIWVCLILFGLGSVIIEPSEALGSIQGTASMIMIVTAVPFALTWEHCKLCCGKHQDDEENHEGIPKTTPGDNTAFSTKYPTLSHNPPSDHPPENELSDEFVYNGPDFDSVITKKAYRYRILNGVDEFRLLNISPGSFNDVLHGEVTLARFSGTDRPAYDALSYTWADETGDDERSSEFLCDEDHSTIRITKNCEAAIRRLRLENEKRWIWIDAICIDQSSTTERTYQVSLMSKIYMASRGVMVYTGEGTPHTDLLFDWLNGLKTEDLDILLKWDLDNLAVDTMISIEKYFTVGKERLLGMFSKTTESKIEISQEELIELAREFFARRWFKRVWVLQEVSLPDVRNTTVICGSKSTTAIRALHALSLIYKDQSGTMIRIFVLLRKNAKIRRSHLLDVLIETRDREAGDPRDKIFGVLSIANYLDKGMYPELKAEYSLTTAQVYEYYSKFFIQHHGVGFFLALIKSPPKLESLASWAADWTVPWPNYKAVAGRDFAAGSRKSKVQDSDAIFITENDCQLLTLLRPRILKGYITRNGHIDDEKEARISSVDNLQEDEVLIQMYPGSAALLRKEEDQEYHCFMQVCPHALTEDGVADLVSRWSTVVVDGESRKDLESTDHLGPIEPFKIR